MKVLFNRQLITQKTFDSGTLSVLGSISHNFAELGEYYGTVLRGTETASYFKLKVEYESSVMQVNIDLATLVSDSQFIVNPKGYVVFYVSSSTNVYAVIVSRVNAESEFKPFDSRELNEGDLLAVTLIQPGTYSVTNVYTDAKAEVTVTLPPKEDVPFRPPAPVTIECNENGFSPDKIAIASTQGQIYTFGTMSRIRIDLVTSDNTSMGLRSTEVRQSQGVRWRKPLSSI